VPDPQAPRTLYDKLWDSHVVEELPDGDCLIYIDRHIIHEVSSPQAFESLRLAERKPRRPQAMLAVPDHNVPTDPVRGTKVADANSALQLRTLQENCAASSIPYIPMLDPRQGIVHIIGPEQGFTLPGTTLVCGDSHSSTHGAFGTLAFGIGTSDVEHVMATQTLILHRSASMRIEINGPLPAGVTAKDIALAVIAKIGAAGGSGRVIEFAGSTVTDLSMEGRMTLCNMAIEAGARAGLIAPDDKTFEYLQGRPLAPKGSDFEAALAYWRTLASDPGARFDQHVSIEAQTVAPQVTWGTSPQDCLPITGRVPAASDFDDPERAASVQGALDYMGLRPGLPLCQINIDRVFIGSCTNSRIEDIRAVAAVVSGRKVMPRVQAMVVPGSGLVKRQAEHEGLDKILTDAGFEWRQPGCSMCVAINADRLAPGERCASTSNRNFEGRQGPGGRTHLMSPAMAAAAAITGHLTDVRDW